MRGVVNATLSSGSLISHSYTLILPSPSDLLLPSAVPFPPPLSSTSPRSPPCPFSLPLSCSYSPSPGFSSKLNPHAACTLVNSGRIFPLLPPPRAPSAALGRTWSHTCSTSAQVGWERRTAAHVLDRRVKESFKALRALASATASFSAALRTSSSEDPWAA